MPRRDARFLRARARGSVPPSDVTIIFQDTILRRRRCDAEVAPTAVIKNARRVSLAVPKVCVELVCVLVQQARWLCENRKF